MKQWHELTLDEKIELGKEFVLIVEQGGKAIDKMDRLSRSDARRIVRKMANDVRGLPDHDDISRKAFCDARKYLIKHHDTHFELVYACNGSRDEFDFRDIC